jgi:Lon protease-like protein
MMDELGLFPLGIVLLPGERVPLHIFEDRYKELIGECLALGTEFGLILADDDGMRGVGTGASVEAVLERFDDGRMNIVIVGGRRFAVDGMTSGRSFDTARVIPYEDEPGSDRPSAEESERCLRSFRVLAEAADAVGQRPDPKAESLAFDLAGHIAFGAADKQELLEMRGERARVLRLTELMEEAAEALRRRASIRKRARSNGHVEEE